jgi:GT2 family glycosyltransferase
MRRLDIGVASYRNPEKLRATLASIEAMSTTDWRCFIVHNESDDFEGHEALRVARDAYDRNRRFMWMGQANTGYAGAVNRIFELAETPYVAYLDNDVEIRTRGWDEQFCALLDAHPEVAQVFPGAGHYGFHNGAYDECLWSAGYAWAIRREAIDKEYEWWQQEYPGTLQPTGMDQYLGHHEEVDLMIRLRLAGYRIACIPGVDILHHESSTKSPESAKRIHAGVVRWMNKWNRYFVGDVLTYPNPDPDSGEGYDPRSLRYTDWPPCALYLERWTLAQFPDWNSRVAESDDDGGQVRRVMTSAGEMDAIEILKPKGCYVGRAI